eukprot:10563964-Karenia_brevis.AAC.1
MITIIVTIVISIANITVIIMLLHSIASATRVAKGAEGAASALCAAAGTLNGLTTRVRIGPEAPLKCSGAGIRA